MSAQRTGNEGHPGEKVSRTHERELREGAPILLGILGAIVGPVIAGKLGLGGGLGWLAGVLAGAGGGYGLGALALRGLSLLAALLLLGA